MAGKSVPNQYRCLMSDQKTERLLNLTIALLATQRYLTKSEIFQSVAGYSGEIEAMERMFERDKDDLRSLGIEIEVRAVDVLFEDQMGYRIRPSDYALDLGPITPRELALISVALQGWRTSALSQSSQTALRKLRSLGIDTDTDQLAMEWLRFENEQPSFDLLWDALEKRQIVEFGYAHPSSPMRRVQPYGLTLLHGFWYLIGFDLDRQDIRTFKIARVLTPFTLLKKERSYEIPEDFSPAKYLETDSTSEVGQAVVHIRKNHCLTLRLEGEVKSVDDDWDEITLRYHHEDPFLRKILWFGSDARVVSPPDLVHKVKTSLQGSLL